MPLPIKTSIEDVEQVVVYLKPRITGSTLAEAKSILDNRLLDGRKMTAYERWGFITRDGDRLRLTDRGRELSRPQSEESKILAIREAICSIAAYQMALEWMHHRRFESVDVDELGNHWLKHMPNEIGSENEGTIREQVTTFFGLAHAAGLGSYLVGRRGHQTRFEVSRQELSSYLSDGGSAESVETKAEDPAPLDRDDESRIEASSREAEEPIPFPQQQPLATPSKAIFVGHGKNHQALEKLQRLLTEFKVPFKVAVNEPNLGRPIPIKVRQVMLECSSAILIFTRDEEFTDERGGQVWRPSENVVFELGAASFQYEDRVVILKEKGVVFPSNFASVGYIEFEVDSLESKTMEIMRELIGLGLLKLSAA